MVPFCVSWGPFGFPGLVPVLCRVMYLAVAIGFATMEEVFIIREAVVSAVCSNKFHRLAGCIQRLAKVAPSKEILLHTGIGHLISDRHLWGLAGHIVQRRAAALHGKWRLHFRQARALGQVSSKKAPAKPHGRPRPQGFPLVRACLSEVCISVCP